MAHCPSNGNFLCSADSPSGKSLGLVLPYARTAVLKFYGHDANEQKVCPGEARCDRYKAAAGKTKAAKEKNACFPCEMFPTKTDEGKASHTQCVELASRAIRIRREHVAGYPRSRDRMSNLEYETYLIVDELCESEEVRHRTMLERMLMAGFGLKEK